MFPNLIIDNIVNALIFSICSVLPSVSNDLASLSLTPASFKHPSHFFLFSSVLLCHPFYLKSSGKYVCECVCVEEGNEREKTSLKI